MSEALSMTSNCQPRDKYVILAATIGDDMPDLFWLHLVFAFVVGSIWVTLTTIAAERFGSKVGGFVGGLPSTAVVSFFFIGLSQTPVVASQATTVFPLAYGITGLFLVLYATLANKGFWIALLGSLTIWFILSALIVLFDVKNYAFSLITYGLILLLSLYVLERELKLTSAPRARIQLSPWQIVWRGAFAGLMIAFVVFISRFGGPIFGGIFSAFPAVFISTLIISYQSRGIQFSRAITKPLLVTGMITIVIYSIGVRYFYPSLGLVLGTFVAYAIAMVSAYFTAIFLQKKLA
jgi:uncharacterized membrane protein (GlpM family)